MDKIMSPLVGAVGQTIFTILFFTAFFLFTFLFQKPGEINNLNMVNQIHIGKQFITIMCHTQTIYRL